MMNQDLLAQFDKCEAVYLAQQAENRELQGQLHELNVLKAQIKDFSDENKQLQNLLSVQEEHLKSASSLYRTNEQLVETLRTVETEHQEQLLTLQQNLSLVTSSSHSIQALQARREAEKEELETKLEEERRKHSRLLRELDDMRQLIGAEQNSLLLLHHRQSMQREDDAGRSMTIILRLQSERDQALLLLATKEKEHEQHILSLSSFQNLSSSSNRMADAYKKRMVEQKIEYEAIISDLRRQLGIGG
ncbi:hypothetical protein BLNAU_2278 [Blattamonas nauphoetae]|uniref:Uncharacterized protein n=1 Tax=Blattamonas nauphoetae TaxID=2049346 RepID=A0ABQ9YGK3_9EUKA|nr:hypothetical protein BLNAU_2278 [Blattamonas nauphoetae]